MKVSVNKFFLNIVMLLSIIALAACNGTGQGFSGAEETSVIGDDNAITPIVIDSHSPTDNPVIMTDSSTVTFALSLSSGTQGANYNFQLDGVSLQSSSIPFLNLAGSHPFLTPGDHELKIIITNPISTDFYLFYIRKNSAPVISTFSPTDPNGNVTCATGSLVFDISANDVDENDNLSIRWLVNNSDIFSDTFTTTTTTNRTATESQITSHTEFSPGCNLSGAPINLSAEISDGKQTTTKTWVINIINPAVASIDSTSPTTNPTILIEGQVKNFLVSASGQIPLIYSWKLDGNTISGADTASYTLTAASLTAGPHTLEITVTDAGTTTDSYVFNIIKNAPPVLSVENPDDSHIKVNYLSTKTFGASATDANGDNLTFTWTLDGGSNPQLSSQSPTSTSSTALITPTESMLGNHTLSVTVSDGYESSTHSWTLTINRFSDACNLLQAGEVCTLVGPTGLGEDQTQKRGKPAYMTEDLDNPGNFFISDYSTNVVWYENRGDTNITRMGINIPAHDAKVIVGTGASSWPVDSGKSNINFPLYRPLGMAYDTVTHSLFIADQYNQRIVQVLDSGEARRVAGRASRNATNNAATNTDDDGDPSTTDDLAINTVLYRPVDVVIDIKHRLLYVSSYYIHAVKQIRMDLDHDGTDEPYTEWTSKIIIGKRTTGGTSAVNTTASQDYGITSGVQNPTALALNSTGQLLFIAEIVDKVKVVNIPKSDIDPTDSSLVDSSVTFFGDKVVDVGKVENLFGSSYGTATGIYTSIKIRDPFGLELYEQSGNIKGIFVADTYNHKIMFVNNSGAEVIIGGATIPANEGQYIFNEGGGYNGTSNSAVDTRLYRPMGLELSSNNILYTLDSYDYIYTHSTANLDSGHIIGVDISVNNGNVSQLRYFKPLRRREENVDPRLVGINRPVKIKYNSARKSLFFAEDYTNSTIKKVDLTTGSVNWFLGLYGLTDQEDSLPTVTTTRFLEGMTFYQNSMIYAERDSTGTPRHCLVRAYNENSIDTDFFNKTVAAGTISSLAGSTIGGCSTTWDSAQNGGAATDATLMSPESIFVFNNDLYINNLNGGCILKVASDGSINPFLGECGSPGDVDGPIADGSVRLRYAYDITIDPQYALVGNFFFINRGRENYASLKYVNRSNSDITIGGTTIASGSVGTILSISGAYSTGLATFENWICYTSGYQSWDNRYGAHNVQCFDRTAFTTGTSFKVGPNSGSSIYSNNGRLSLNSAEEGENANNVHLLAPYDVEFDDEGNLYISEYIGNRIRMVKRWW